MNKTTQILLALAGLTVMNSGTAQAATEYPYCMFYNEGWSGAIERCEFSTIDQCRASASGLNGYCMTNRHLAWKQNPAPEPETPRKRIRR